MGKMRVILCGTLLLCCLAVVVFGSSDLDQSGNQNSNPNTIPAENLELSRLLERQNVQENRIQELEKSRDELKSKVTSLEEEMVQLKQNISRENGVLLLTARMRGPPGKPGKNGEDGLPGSAGLAGPKGDIGEGGLPGLSGFKGDKGDGGLPGPAGSFGSSGRKGESGRDGNKGEGGLPGLSGFKGDRGDGGLPGPAGSVGFSGQKGESGRDGEKGLRGPGGRQGPPGVNGLVGPTGPKGGQGSTGQTGGQGSKGSQGDRGSTGQTGGQGLNGQKGDQGSKGSQGAQGPIGQIGGQGSKGQKGDRGTTGQMGGRVLSDPKLIKSCNDAMENLPSPRSAIQQIHPGGKTLEVLCDFKVGGGWTIIQKRSSGPQDQFDRGWSEYAAGFGSLDGNFWLGLDNIRALTKSGDQELRIEMEDFNGTTKYAKYSNFSVADATDFYRLSISGYSGNAGDSMQSHNGMKFGTKDKEISDSNTCGAFFASGWWFANCFWVNLNGLYRERGETVPNAKGIRWNAWSTSNFSLAQTVMQIRTKT